MYSKRYIPRKVKTTYSLEQTNYLLAELSNRPPPAIYTHTLAHCCTFVDCLIAIKSISRNSVIAEQQRRTALVCSCLWPLWWPTCKISLSFNWSIMTPPVLHGLAPYSPTTPALYNSSISQKYLLYSLPRVSLSTRSMASSAWLSIPVHARTSHCRRWALRLPPNHATSQYSCGSQACTVRARPAHARPCPPARQGCSRPRAGSACHFAHRRARCPTADLCTGVELHNDELHSSKQ
jgi:hypothetical protein